MRRGIWHDTARALAAKGVGRSEIARRIGVTPSAVTKALDPEKARAWSRRDNARPERQAAKRAWDDTNRAACVDCGAILSAASLCKGRQRCVPCRHKFLRASHALRDKQIEAWWAEGLSLREIADRLGWTLGHLSVEIDRLRKRGADIPYRYSTKRIRAAAEAARRARAA